MIASQQHGDGEDSEEGGESKGQRQVGREDRRRVTTKGDRESGDGSRRGD